MADIYSITVKYYSPRQDTITGKLMLTEAGGRRMMEQPAGFTFTRPGKWNTITVNTGNMINAGSYIFKLVLENAEQLAISGIDVQ